MDLNALNLPLNHSSVVKIIHNAGFDATRLSKHYNFNPNPIFDTMLAARRNGDRKYSLKAQAEIHLNLHLDKRTQTSDWSLRPLKYQQLYYAALDPYATLLLCENQLQRGLEGIYRLKPPVSSTQNLLPLDNSTTLFNTSDVNVPTKVEDSSSKCELSEEAVALLGIITEMPTRYSPASLAASVGSEERVGIMGWIIDKRLGADAEPDDEAVKLAINNLCDRGFVEITETRRLKATETGESLWQSVK